VADGQQTCPTTILLHLSMSIFPARTYPRVSKKVMLLCYSQPNPNIQPSHSKLTAFFSGLHSTEQYLLQVSQCPISNQDITRLAASYAVTSPKVFRILQSRHSPSTFKKCRLYVWTNIFAFASHSPPLLQYAITTFMISGLYERWNALKPRQFLWMVAKCLAGL
jgi:hypothetical protein